MRFTYSKAHSGQSDLDSLPRLHLKLKLNNVLVDVFGLVDSGATINVLPFQLGNN